MKINRQEIRSLEWAIADMDFIAEAKPAEDRTKHQKNLARIVRQARREEEKKQAEAAYDKAVEELVIAWIESSAIIRERCPYEWAFITKALAPFLEKAKEGKS